MKKQPEVTDATRARILDAFWRLFETHEIETITINRLSGEAGIHRSSFYRYFPDIYAVLDAYEAQLLCALRQRIDAIVLETGTDIELYSQRVTQVLAENADKLYRLFRSSCGSAFRQLFCANLQEEVRRMYGLDGTLEDLDYYATLMSSILLTNLSFWYENRQRYSFRDINAKCRLIIGEGLTRIHESHNRAI